MVTYKLEDDGPTTTITFDAFTTIAEKIITQDLAIFAYPDNEGVEVIYFGSCYSHFTIEFEFNDEPGKTAYEKWEEFRQLVKQGGDNEWVFTLTFTKPDQSGTESWTGKVIGIDQDAVGGDNVAQIEGSFEFAEDTISGS